MTQGVKRSGNTCSFFPPIYRASIDNRRATKGDIHFPGGGEKRNKNHEERTNRNQNHPGRAKQGPEACKRQQNHQAQDCILPGDPKDGSAVPAGEEGMSSCTTDRLCFRNSPLPAALGHFGQKKGTRTGAPLMKGQVSPPNYLPHFLGINKRKEARNGVL